MYTLHVGPSCNKLCSSHELFGFLQHTVAFTDGPSEMLQVQHCCGDIHCTVLSVLFHDRAGKRTALREHMQTKDHKELVKALEEGMRSGYNTQVCLTSCRRCVAGQMHLPAARRLDGNGDAQTALLQQCCKQHKRVQSSCTALYLSVRLLPLSRSRSHDLVATNQPPINVPMSYFLCDPSGRIVMPTSDAAVPTAEQLAAFQQFDEAAEAGEPQHDPAAAVADEPMTAAAASALMQLGSSGSPEQSHGGLVSPVTPCTLGGILSRAMNAHACAQRSELLPVSATALPKKGVGVNGAVLAAAVAKIAAAAGLSKDDLADVSRKLQQYLNVAGVSSCMAWDG